MFGRTHALLYNPNLGGAITELLVSLRNDDDEERLRWLETSVVKRGESLERNALMILENFIDPLAKELGVASPRFEISFQKNSFIVYGAGEQVVGDRSAGVSLLVAMVSVLLRLPVNQSVVATGHIEPPHNSIRVIDGIQDKLDAAFKVEGIDRVLAPDPEKQFAGLSDVPREASEYRRKFESIRQSQRNVRPVSEIDEIWPEFFPHEIIYEAAMTNPDLYAWIVSPSKEKSILSGLSKHIEALYMSRWDYVRVFTEKHGSDGFQSVFPVVLEFYLSNKIDPGDVYSNLKDIVNDPELALSGSVLKLTQWSALSKLYSLEQYDDLLRLLHLAGNEKRSSRVDHETDPLWSDPSFRERVRETLISLGEERDFWSLLQLMIILGRKFTVERALVDLRPDVNVILKEKFFDAWLNTWVETQQNDNEEEQETRLQGLREILQSIDSGLRILESLAHVDPLLAHTLRQHALFHVAEGCLRKALDILNSDDSTKRELVLASRDQEVFSQRYSQIQTYDDRIGDRIVLKDSQIQLEPDKPTLRIEVAEDLSSLEFKPLPYAFSKFPNLVDLEIHGGNVLPDPALLWQESLNLPNYWKSTNWRRDRDVLLNLPDGRIWENADDGSRLMKPGLIQGLFSNSYIEIKYGDVSVIWSLFFRWPPSIDSLFFAHTLKRHGYFDRSMQRIADVGSGTGFLGIVLAKNNESITELYASDVATSLKLLTEYNIERNLRPDRSRDLSTLVVAGSGLQAVADYAPFDLVICSPPYLPQREKYQADLNLESPVDGVDLLEEVIISGKSLAKEIVIELSEIAYPEFSRAVELTGATAELLDAKCVPLRIPPIAPYSPHEDGAKPGSAEWEHSLMRFKKLKRYTNMLVQERGLRELNEKNYKYWHEVQVYSVTY